MNIKITRDEDQSVWSLINATDDEAAKVTVRRHVRAYDSDDDKLLEIYLATAIDYLQEISNRVLGTSVVTIKLDKDEIQRPVLIPKVQRIAHVHSLMYRTKDGDDAMPYSGTYSFYEEEIPDDDAAEGVTMLIQDGTEVLGRAIEIPHTGHTTSLTIYGIGYPEGFVGTSKQQALYYWDTTTDDWALYEDVDEVDESWDGTSSRQLTHNAHLEKNLYEFRDTITDDEDVSHTSKFHFVVTDGTDLFDGQVITDRYPMYLDIKKLATLPTDASKYNEDYVRLVVDAGTAYSALPMQYVQAALLLVGHYYNMREAENIGGITTEVKEGVHRLIQSVRQY